jgi:hypothetical protein
MEFDLNIEAAVLNYGGQGGPRQKEKIYRVRTLGRFFQTKVELTLKLAFH